MAGCVTSQACQERTWLLLALGSKAVPGSAEQLAGQGDGVGGLHSPMGHPLAWLLLLEEEEPGGDVLGVIWGADHPSAGCFAVPGCPAPQRTCQCRGTSCSMAP